MPTFTTNLNMNKPIVNSATDEDLWGDQLNTNADILDSEAVLATVDKDWNDKTISQAIVKDFAEGTHDLGVVNGALVIDYRNGHYQYATVNGDITSVTINNFPATGNVGFLSLELTQDGTGGHTITLSSSFKTIGGGGIVLTTTGDAIDLLRFETRDQGSNIHTFINGDMK